MSWTVRPPSLAPSPRGAASAGWREELSVLSTSMTSVAISTAPITTATTPPTKPETRFEPMWLPKLVGAAARVRWQHHQSAQARQQAAAGGERTAQLAAVALAGRAGLARRRVAERAQEPHVARGGAAVRHAQPPL